MVRWRAVALFHVKHLAAVHARPPPCAPCVGTMFAARDSARRSSTDQRAHRDHAHADSDYRRGSPPVERRVWPERWPKDHLLGWPSVAPDKSPPVLGAALKDARSAWDRCAVSAVGDRRTAVPRWPRFPRRGAVDHLAPACSSSRPLTSGAGAGRGISDGPFVPEALSSPPCSTWGMHPRRTRDEAGSCIAVAGEGPDPGAPLPFGAVGRTATWSPSARGCRSFAVEDAPIGAERDVSRETPHQWLSRCDRALCHWTSLQPRRAACGASESGIAPAALVYHP